MCLRASFRTFWASSQQQNQWPCITYILIYIAYRCLWPIAVNNLRYNTTHIKTTEIHWESTWNNQNTQVKKDYHQNIHQYLASLWVFAVVSCLNCNKQMTHCNGPRQQKQLTSTSKVLFQLLYLVILGTDWGSQLDLDRNAPHPQLQIASQKYHWVLLQKVLSFNLHRASLSLPRPSELWSHGFVIFYLSIHWE